MDSSKFRSILSELYSNDLDKTHDVDQTSSKFVQELLNFGSETPDNLNCADHIEFGRFTLNEQTRVGLKIRKKNIPISLLMNVLENMTLPQEVKDHYPELEEYEWDAVTRVITLLLIALER